MLLICWRWGFLSKIPEQVKEMKRKEIWLKETFTVTEKISEWITKKISVKIRFQKTKTKKKG